MKYFALFDKNVGNFMWFGRAAGIGDAIRALDKKVNGLDPSGEQRLGVYIGTEEQIASIERWHRHSANGFPKGISAPIVFDAIELQIIIGGREWISKTLQERLEFNTL